MEEKKAKKKWGKWVLLAFVLCALIGGVQEALTGSVSSAEDGEKVVEEIFPPEEGYHIEFTTELYGWESAFDEPAVGDVSSFEAYEGKGDKVTIYDYAVWFGDDSHDFTSCDVSETGKVLGYGPLVSESDPWTVYRLK